MVQMFFLPENLCTTQLSVKLCAIVFFGAHFYLRQSTLALNFTYRNYLSQILTGFLKLTLNITVLLTGDDKVGERGVLFI